MDLFFQIVFTGIGTFLSVMLTKLLVQNGKVLEEIRGLGLRMDEGFRRMDEGFRELGRRMDEGFRRMDERTAKIAELIALEADKTRELIRALKL